LKWIFEEKTQLAATKEKIELAGTVVEALPNTMLEVRLQNGHDVLARMCGRMRRYYIHALLGDKVLVEVWPYDLTRGENRLSVEEVCRTTEILVGVGPTRAHIRPTGLGACRKGSWVAFRDRED